MIEQFKARYDDIMAGEAGAMRDYRLAALMTDMEGAFNVPTLKDEQWESANPAVADLYREVSHARGL